MVSFAKESVVRCYDEVAGHAPAHSEEVTSVVDRTLNISLDHYLGLEEAGILHIFTARDEELAGYAAVMIVPDPHHGSLRAIYDCVYIVPDKRGFGSEFISWVDGQVKGLGAGHVFQEVPTRHDHSDMLKRSGYRAVSTNYCKELT